MLKYSVTHTEGWTYLDALRNPVQGFRVTFNILELNETHVVYVPSLAAAPLKAVIEKLVAEREGLIKLGQ